MLGTILGAVAGPLIGGLLGGSSSKKGTTTTSEKKLDPRMDRFVYGEDGKSGLLGSAYDMTQQQFRQGGLNDMQRSGLESQRQVLASPQFTQGYDAMRSMGMGLMGGGVAQNPFTSGAMSAPQMQRPMAPVRPNTNMQYQPYTPQQTPALAGMQTPFMSVDQYRAQTPTASAPTPKTIEEMIEAYMKRFQQTAYSDTGYGYGEGHGGGMGGNADGIGADSGGGDSGSANGGSGD